MWGRSIGQEESVAAPRVSDAPRPSGCRRAYYRVSGMLPLRITKLEPGEVEAAIFDLSLPDPLLAPLSDEVDDSPLALRLRRIEEKLDLLLGSSPVEVPEQLSGRDRKPVVFSGSGLAIDVDFTFRRGERFRVELLLPPPYCRTLRSVATAVVDHADAPRDASGELASLALALTDMEDEERDALVAYSYDVQRFALRTRVEIDEEAR